MYDVRITKALFGIPEIDLDLVDLFEDFTGIGFDIRAQCFNFATVIRLMKNQILFEVGEFNVNLGQADFHVNPNGNNGHKKR